MAQSPFGGIKLFNMGEPGSGKTTAIKSIMDAGLDCRGIFTEPGHGVVSGDPRLKFRYIPPASPGWDSITELAELSNTLTLGEKGGIKGYPFDRSKCRQMFDVLAACNNFIDDRTHQECGPIEGWGTDVCFFFDSMTGLVELYRTLAVGSKPSLTWPEYDVVQQNVLKFVNKLWTGLRCHVYITAHIDLLRDPTSGNNTIMARTIGNAISPVIHVNATDAVMSIRRKDTFTWTAAYEGALVKAQHVPLTEEIPQSFGLLLEKWTERGGIVEREDRNA